MILAINIDRFYTEHSQKLSFFNTKELGTKDLVLCKSLFLRVKNPPFEKLSLSRARNTGSNLYTNRSFRFAGSFISAPFGFELHKAVDNAFGDDVQLVKLIVDIGRIAPIGH